MEDRVNSAPSKRSIDCLVVTKVYDAFSKRECLENLPFELDLPGGCLEDYTFCYTEFGKAVRESYEKEPLFSEKDECNARLILVVGIPVYAVVKRNCDGKLFRVPAYPICAGAVQKDNIIRFPIDATVYAPRQFLRQGRFDAFVESLVEVGNATVCNSNCTLVLSLGFFLIIKIVTEVSLKIPNFGFCDAPREIEETYENNFCELFLDEDVTPFPIFFPRDNEC